MKPPVYFRAGAAAVIIDSSRRVLALERRDVHGAWQLPQGGLEAGEEPLNAVFREVEEETGIRKADLVLLDQYPHPLAYELPPKLRSEKRGRGQVQYWFLFELRGDPSRIDTTGAEFDAFRWMRFEELLKTVAPFRAHVYAQLAERFRDHLQKPR